MEWWPPAQQVLCPKAVHFLYQRAQTRFTPGKPAKFTFGFRVQFGGQGLLQGVLQDLLYRVQGLPHLSVNKTQSYFSEKNPTFSYTPNACLSTCSGLVFVSFIRFCSCYLILMPHALCMQLQCMYVPLVLFRWYCFMLCMLIVSVTIVTFLLLF